MDHPIVVDELDPPGLEAALPDLARLLAACVAGGAGVSFVQPFAPAEAEAWWRRAILPTVTSGARRVLVARQAGRILGSAQLVLDLPPNQAHRADVSKVLVFPDARRRGVGRALMRAIEELAARRGRSVLLLDTVTGSAAEEMYRSLGWVEVGVVPRFARSADDHGWDATTFFWKDLEAA